MNNRARKPDFQILGEQKCGTTWLWNMLRQHPQISMPANKESYFFSLSLLYHQGLDTYYQQFSGLPSSKIIGETSTDYFNDSVLIDNHIADGSLPTIPELIIKELPDIKVFIVLRDPVKRAISAYYHHMAARRISPKTSIREAETTHPSLRILKRGYYARHLALWQSYLSKNKMKIFILEEDILKNPVHTIRESFCFLGVNTEFKPIAPDKSLNERRGWTHLLLTYYLGQPYDLFFRTISKTPLSPILSKMNVIKQPPISEKDIAFLRHAYLPERDELERLLGRSLACWTYQQ